MEKFDLVTIGDNATDAFIRLKEAELNCDINREACKICLRFASKIPYESVTVIPAGGNGSNVAVGAAKLGLKTAFVSNVGADGYGEQTKEALAAAGVDTSFIKTNLGSATNYNYVLWYQDDRTILVKHENYSYELPDIGEPSWLYLASVGDGALELHYTIARFLENHPNTRLAFSPGTMQILAGYEKISDIYKATDILFCNKQEAMRILKTDNEKIEKLTGDLKDLGPKTVVITDGAGGAYCLNDKGLWHSPIFPTPGPAIERTGAGDAFSAAFLTAIMDNRTEAEALSWGAINSSSVVMQVGPRAGLLTREQITSALAAAPLNFQVVNLSTNNLSQIPS